MKRPAIIHLRGRRYSWSMPVEATEADLAEWRADGLEVYAVESRIPEWLPSVLVRPWAWCQAAWQWGRLW